VSASGIRNVCRLCNVTLDRRFPSQEITHSPTPEECSTSATCSSIVGACVECAWRYGSSAAPAALHSRDLSLWEIRSQAPSFFDQGGHGVEMGLYGMSSEGQGWVRSSALAPDFPITRSPVASSIRSATP
jgi:hypothetical protein